MNKTEYAEKIQFHHLYPGLYLPDRSRLKRFLLKQLKAAGRRVELINYIFCTDAYLLTLNQDFLQHNTYTDIITFELSPKGQPLLADIYISAERVKENAKEYGVPFKQELARVIFHGALHLAGYKDKTKADTAQMRLQEDLWLSLYNVPRGKKRGKD